MVMKSFLVLTQRHLDERGEGKPFGKGRERRLVQIQLLMESSLGRRARLNDTINGSATVSNFPQDLLIVEPSVGWGNC